MTFASEEPRYIVEFLEHCIADFGWYEHLIFYKGHVIENLREEQLHERPREKDLGR